MDTWAVVDAIEGGIAGNGLGPTVSGRVFRGSEVKVPALLFKSVDDASIIESALSSALASGLISKAQEGAIRDALKMQTARMYVASFGLESYAVPDNYGLDVWLTDANGAEIYRASTGFTYLSVAAFDLDFSIVDFGKLVPAQSSYIAGDDRFVSNDGRPTIRNVGNIPFRPGLAFSPMVDSSGAPRVVDFGAKFSGEQLNLKAGSQQCFTKSLAPGQSAAMDFSVSLPPGIPASTYSGSFRILSCDP